VSDSHQDGGGRTPDRAKCRGGAGPLVDVDVSWLVQADLAAVDAVARLQLVAVRRGRSLRLHGAHRDLVGLVELAGLSDVLGVCGCPPRFRADSDDAAANPDG